MPNSSQESQDSIQQKPPHRKCEAAAPAASVKKKRNLPGNPDPDAEVVALSPRTLLATNRYVCEVCHKGFQRDQNLQLHRRGHNLPWKLKQRAATDVKKKVYICPEVTCAHHDPSRALGDLTGIKKHFSRKHGEKKWKCDKCSKKYAVQSDWKAHLKICGTKEYRCDCGTIFSRKDSFVTHRAFCDAMAEQTNTVNHGLAAMVGNLRGQPIHDSISPTNPSSHSLLNSAGVMDTSFSHRSTNNPLKSLSLGSFIPSSSETVFSSSSISRASGFHNQINGIAVSDFGAEMSHMDAGSYLSATALLQKAAEMGSKVSSDSVTPVMFKGFTGYSTSTRASRPLQDPFIEHTHNAFHGLQAPMINLDIYGAGFTSAQTGRFYAENQIANETRMKWAENMELNQNAPDLQGRSFPPSPQTNDQKSDSASFLQDGIGNHVNGVAQGVTQNFLSLGPVGTLYPGISDQNCHDQTTGFRNYSTQQKTDELTSYNQASPDHTTLEKSMWEL